jgi:acylglycerol lipase
MFHGLNGHLNNCAHVAQAISKINLDVVGFDYRGFGKS